MHLRKSVSIAALREASVGRSARRTHLMYVDRLPPARLLAQRPPALADLADDHEPLQHVRHAHEDLQGKLAAQHAERACWGATAVERDQ